MFNWKSLINFCGNTATVILANIKNSFINAFLFVLSSANQNTCPLKSELVLFLLVILYDILIQSFEQINHFKLNKLVCFNRAFNTIFCF